MKPVSRRAWIALCLTACCTAAFGADDFYLKSNDRVVFYGDSITDQRLYTTFAETYVLTRYPTLNVTFTHSGWGGDKVSGGGGGPVDVRLKRDVIAYKPNVMTIMLGMNDGLYRAATPENDQVFFKGYENIVDTVKKALPGIRITAIQPSPYDDVTRTPLFPGGYNAVLIGFSRWIADYAGKAGLTVADFNTPMVAMLQNANQTDATNAQKILPDRVHPAAAGHLIMAEQLIKAWHGRPVVASVTIDASADVPKLQSAEHAKISDLRGGGSIGWTELDEALPLPFATWTDGRGGELFRLTIQSSDAVDALNQEPLKVTGLKEGKYALAIDGKTVGTFSSEDLAKGVNLGTLSTPMSEQAEEVHKLTLAHATIHNDRWRSIQVPLEEYKLKSEKAASNGLDELDRELIQKQRNTAKPRAHTFQLTPAA